MYKEMIPAATVTRQAQLKRPADEVKKPAFQSDVSAQQISTATLEYVALQKQLAAEEQRYIGLAADFENFKKRTAQEMDRRAAVQKDALVRDMLPVIDNLERALASAAPTSVKRMREGIVAAVNPSFAPARL